MVKKFSKEAIKHKGSLRRFAEQHHLVKKDGLIDLRKAHAYATRNHLPHRLRQIHLAATLRKLRLGMCADCPKG